MTVSSKLRPLVAVLICWELAAGAGFAQGRLEREEFFEKAIRPVLVERCLQCHGPEKAKGGLRLDSRAAVLQGGNSGPIVVAGKPSESLLIEALRYEGANRMPPKGKLPDAQIQAFVRWVELDLPWPPVTAPVPVRNGPILPESKGKTWWSFQPVRRPSLPPVRDATWPRSEIDRFILARLEREKLQPAPAVDKRTWLRRATFDLTGLPPTPAETAAFLADESPQAYAKVVDRLLASPHYGERWGRHWLDLVRYTDSFDARIRTGPGQEMDVPDAWRYRDWVVRSFNRDLPYDQFIRQQLAGDRLAHAAGRYDPEPVIATGLLALGNWGGGDADKEKLLTDIVDDQIDVVGRCFLGVTLACARCHDHKFDPFTTEDYYGLAGIFFSSHILQNPGPKTNGPPMLRIPLAAPEELRRRQQREALLAALEQRQKTILAPLPVPAQQQGRDEIARYLPAAWEYRERAASQPSLSRFARERGLQADRLRRWVEFLAEPSESRHLTVPVRDLLNRPGLHVWRGSRDTPSLCVNTTAAEQAFGTIKMPPRSVAAHPSPAGGVAIAWQAPTAMHVRVSGLVADADSVCGDGVAWQLEHRQGDRSRVLLQGKIPNGGRATFGEEVPSLSVRKGESLVLIILPNGEYTCDTTQVELRVQETSGPQRVWNVTEEILSDPLLANPRPDRHGHSETWHFLDLAPPPFPVMVARTPAWQKWMDSLAAAAKQPDRSAQVRQAAQELQQAMRSDEVATGSNAPLWQALTAADGPLGMPPEEHLLPWRERAALTVWRSMQRLMQSAPLPAMPMAHGCREGGCPQSPQAGIHDVRIHLRGRYDRLGAVVPRRMPLVLMHGPQPVLAPDSSGRLEMAQWIASPANPLTARVLVNRVWQHHFGTGLVRTPSNFGKLGEPPTHPELLDYLADEFVRGGWSLKRLHRQIMLSAVYRQSAHPSPELLQRDPDNRLWSRMNRPRLDAEALRDSLLAATDRLDPTLGGPAVTDLHARRRTLYLLTVRSDRTSFRELFDAADPTAIVDARIESTVAPQALFLLNHPFVRTQARLLAERIEREEPRDQERRIGALYQLLFQRAPQPREMKLAQDWLRRHETAGGLTEYVHLLLCSNEFLYID